MNALRYSIREGTSTIQVAVLRSGQIAVDECSQAEVPGISDIGRVHEPGTQDRGAIAILGAQIGRYQFSSNPRTGVIVWRSVSRHMPRACDAQPAGRAPDDHRQLALIMHEFHPRRPTGHPTMTEQGAGTFENTKGSSWP